MEISTYFEYETRIINQLRNKINLSEDEQIRVHYKYQIQGKYYEFDLVVLNGVGEITRIYEIKRLSAIRYNYQYVKYWLLDIKQLTHAEVNLVYENKSGET